MLTQNDVIGTFTCDLKGVYKIDTANILKYVLAWNTNDGLKDLKKARWYLDNLIMHVESDVKIRVKTSETTTYEGWLSDLLPSGRCRACLGNYYGDQQNIMSLKNEKEDK